MRLFYILLFLLFHIQVYGQQKSTYGHIHTPRGHLHGLVIFVGFNNDQFGDKKIARLDENYNDWKFDALPEWAEGSSNFLFDGDTSTTISGTGQDNLSKYFYQMSMGEFLFTADIFPEQVMIDAKFPIRNYASSNTKNAFQWIKDNYPNFDWSKYDQRTNMSKWNYDNSTSSPDGQLDYVYLIFRNLTNSSKGSANIPYKGVFIQNINGEDKTFKINNNTGHYASECSANPKSHQRFFLHEFAHRLYNAPHYFGANDAHGLRFYGSAGWGIMSGTSGTQLFNSCNSWERWYLGWTEIKHDLKNQQDNGIYTLRDFVLTGDAIRIKLPHCDQHLWLEYHSGTSTFDQRPGMWADTDPTGIPFPKPPTGLMAYVEAMPGNRSNVITTYSDALTNNFKMLNASGNYDYYIPEEQILHPPRPANLWKNIIFDFQTVDVNPLGGHNATTPIQYDFQLKNKKPGQDGVIHHNSYWNGAYNEAVPSVAMKDGTIGHYFLGKDAAFQEGDAFGVDENPVVVNHQFYDKKKDSLHPVLLNGIAVEVVSIENGVMQVKIALDDVFIEKRTRFTGNIRLMKLPYVKEDLVITTKAKLVLNQSGTATQAKEISPGSGVFAPPTQLVIDSGAVMRIQRKAKVKLREGSSIVVKNGGTLIVERKGKLKVKKNCTLKTEIGGKVVYE